MQSLRVAWFIAVALTVLLTCGAAVARSVTLFVGPEGKAANSGLSEKDPLPDLASAWTRALAGKEPVTAVEIRVLPGTYLGQHLALTDRSGGRPDLVITRHQDETRPVFDGQGEDLTWLTVAPSSRGGVRIFGLTVTRYLTAISLNGSRTDLGRSISGVVIRNNIFSVIGQQSPKQARSSTAAVRLVNADGVQIVNNRFVDIENREGCGLIHAIYLAHDSTGNLVKGNLFEDSCGDPVRFRDGSGLNVVEDNTFKDAWSSAPISDWYCDSTRRDDCSKRSPECPSFGNRLVGNKMIVERAKKPEATVAYGSDQAASCPVPPPAAERQRFLSR